MIANHLNGNFLCNNFNNFVKYRPSEFLAMVSHCFNIL